MCLIMIIFVLFIILMVILAYFVLCNTKYVLHNTKCIFGGGFDNMDIYMIRHGETDKNKEGKPPTPDTPLNETGRQQAVQTGKQLSKMEPFDCVYVSPFIRTRETAELILNELPYHPNIIFDERLREIDKGNLDDVDDPNDDFNRILKEYKEKYSTDKLFYQHFDEMEDELLKYYTFEKLSEITQRLTEFYEELKSSGHKRVLLIMHKGSIQISMQILFNIGETSFNIGAKRQDFKNCSISHVLYNGDYKLISSANTDHLIL